MGHCLLSSEKYADADKIYNELSKDFGQFRNKAGQPYGIVAMLQLFEISREKGEEEKSLGILLDLYKQIQDGFWVINQSSYDFYISEIESTLSRKLKEGRFPEIQKTYTDIQK